MSKKNKRISEEQSAIDMAKAQRATDRKVRKLLDERFDSANPDAGRPNTQDYDRAKNSYINDSMNAIKSGSAAPSPNTVVSQNEQAEINRRNQAVSDFQRIANNPYIQARANGYRQLDKDGTQWINGQDTGVYSLNHASNDQSTQIGQNPTFSVKNQPAQMNAPTFMPRTAISGNNVRTFANRAAAMQGASGNKTGKTAANSAIDFNTLTPRQKLLAQSASGMPGASNAFQQYTNNIQLSNQTQNDQQYKARQMASRINRMIEQGPGVNEDGTAETHDQMLARIKKYHPQMVTGANGKPMSFVDYVDQNRNNVDVNTARDYAYEAQEENDALNTQMNAEYAAQVQAAKNKNAEMKSQYDNQMRAYEQKLEKAREMKRRGIMPIVQNGEIVNGDAFLDTSGARMPNGRLISSYQIDRLQNNLKGMTRGQQEALNSAAPNVYINTMGEISEQPMSANLLPIEHKWNVDSDIGYLMKRSAGIQDKEQAEIQANRDAEYMRRDPSGELKNAHNQLMADYNEAHTPDGTVGYFEKPFEPLYDDLPKRTISKEERDSADNLTRLQNEADRAERDNIDRLSQALVPTFTKKEQQKQAIDDLKNTPTEWKKAAQNEYAANEKGELEASLDSALARLNKIKMEKWNGEGEFKPYKFSKEQMSSAMALIKSGKANADQSVAHIFDGEPLPEKDANGKVVTPKKNKFGPEYWKNSAKELFGETNLREMDQTAKAELDNALTLFGKKVADAKITDEDSLKNADLNTLRELDDQWNQFIKKSTVDNKALKSLASPFRNYLHSREAESEQADFDATDNERFSELETRTDRKGKKVSVPKYYYGSFDHMMKNADQYGSESDARDAFLKYAAPGYVEKRTMRNTSTRLVSGSPTSIPTQEETAQYKKAQEFWNKYGRSQFARAKNIANRKQWIADNNRRNGKTEDPIFTKKTQN